MNSDALALSAELADELEARRTTKKNMQLLEDRYVELKSGHVVTGEGEVMTFRDWEHELGFLAPQLKDYIGKHGAFGKTYLMHRRVTKYSHLASVSDEMLREWARKGFLEVNKGLVMAFGDDADKETLRGCAVEGDTVALMIERDK